MPAGRHLVAAREAAPACRRDLVDEAVAFVTEAIDLLEQHLPLFSRLLEDLLRGAFSARPDLVSGPQRAGHGLADRGVELFVDGDALAGGVEVGLQRRGALGQLGDSVGKRANDVAGRA